jgi:hypothetical protein
MGGDEAVGEVLGGQVPRTHNPSLFLKDDAAVVAAAAAGNDVAESMVGSGVGWPQAVA